MPSGSNESTPIASVITLAEETKINEMIEAGVFYGCHKSKTNPRMQNFIFAKRGGIEIIDMAKTIEMLDRALEFLKKEYGRGKNILVVGTHPAAAASTEGFAKEFEFPFINKRWIGGLLTNFKTIFGRKEQMKKMRADLLGGVFNSYTKKERLEIERDVHRMEELFSGVESMMQIPDILLIVDPRLHQTAVREASQTGAKIVGLGDTTSDPDSVDYLVIGNTKSRTSVRWFTDQVAGALREAAGERAARVAVHKDDKEKAV